MEFWGVEVKAGEPLKCEPGEDRYVHLSQASLGEFKKEKGSEPVRLYVKVGDQKLVLGTLSSENCTHISFDLVFEKDFELSHNWKNGSVYFCGYKTIVQEEDATPDDFSDSDEEEVPMLLKENGKPLTKEEQPKPASEKANAAKPESSAAKKVKVVEPKKEEDEDDSDDNDEDGDESEEDESDDEDMLDAGDESDEDDEGSEEESSDEEDEATPKKAEQSKKRLAEPASKTPISGKKAKLATPTGQKTGADGKKGVHTATPHPSKQGAKTPAANDKSKQQTPKSGGQFSCKACNKGFNSENALSSHTKAKHSAGK